MGELKDTAKGLGNEIAGNAKQAAARRSRPATLPAARFTND